MTKEMGSIDTELISSSEDEGLLPEDEIVVVSDSNVDLSFLQRLSTLSGRVGKVALPITLAIALTNSACDPDNFFDNNTSYANSTPVVQSSPAFESPPIEYTATPTHETSTMTPSIFPTEVPTNTPTVEPPFIPTIEPTATTEPTSTPTEVPTSTPTPEPEPTKEITYSGKMEYKLNMNITPEDFPIHELKLNPLFNKDGMNAEQVIQRAILKAHYRAYISAHEGRKTPEELKALSPEEFEKRLLAGENMSYPIYGHDLENWDENLKAKPLIVDPSKGLDFAVVPDTSLLSVGSNKVIVRNISTYYGMEYAYVVDPDGKLTCVFHTTSNYADSLDTEYGSLYFFANLMAGAEIMAEATQNSGGTYQLTAEERDLDMRTWVVAPPDSVVDNNQVMVIDGVKYMSLFMR